MDGFDYYRIKRTSLISKSLIRGKNMNKNLSEKVQFALEYIGEGIVTARHNRGLRQSDMSLHASRISRIEKGQDVTVSCLFKVLEDLDMLDSFLEALPFDPEVYPAAARVKHTKQVETIKESSIINLGKPANTSHFERLIEQYGHKDIPVTERTAFVLREKGYATRWYIDEENDQKVFLATTANTAYNSKYTYLTKDGEIGGKRQLTLIMSRKQLSDRQLESCDIWLPLAQSILSELVLPYTMIVANIEVKDTQEHKLLEDGKALKAAFFKTMIEDAIKDAISNMVSKAS